jgi:hypothetical protein
MRDELQKKVTQRDHVKAEAASHKVKCQKGKKATKIQVTGASGGLSYRVTIGFCLDIRCEFRVN